MRSPHTGDQNTHNQDMSAKYTSLQIQGTEHKKEELHNTQYIILKNLKLIWYR
jgi:hypothetical protein